MGLARTDCDLFRPLGGKPFRSHPLKEALLTMTTPHPILMPFSDLQGFLYQEANHCPLGWLTCAAPTTREPSTAHDLSACYSSVPGVG